MKLKVWQNHFAVAERGVSQLTGWQGACLPQPGQWYQRGAHLQNPPGCSGKVCAFYCGNYTLTSSYKENKVKSPWSSWKLTATFYFNLWGVTDPRLENHTAHSSPSSRSSHCGFCLTRTLANRSLQPPLAQIPPGQSPPDTVQLVKISLKWLPKTEHPKTQVWSSTYTVALSRWLWVTGQKFSFPENRALLSTTPQH